MIRHVRINKILAMKTKCSIKTEARKNYCKSAYLPAGWVLALIVLLCLVNSCGCSFEHFWEVKFSDIIQLGLFVLAFITILSARHLQEANTLSNHLDIYKDDKMCTYLRLLHKLRLPSNFQGRTRTCANNPDSRIQIKSGDFSWYENEDEARRKVKFFYENALDLYKRGYIGIEFLDKLASLDAFMVLFDVIEPMECCLNPEYDYEPFHELMVLYKEKYEMLKSKQKHQTQERVLPGKRPDDEQGD